MMGNAVATETKFSLRELVVPLGLVVIVACMIVPLPGAVMDFMLMGNLLFALALLLSTLYISEPLKLSAFPTILLLATLYRLSLNISTTRLILGTGEAGKAIEAFGGVVIQGNLIVGAVVFLVITLVQFIVVAKGAERVAEVSARFTLDALPGKQMSIDADVRAGLIDPDEAQEKRKDLQAESRFYGALDGAMKFVKGDAIAGLVITGINVLGGLGVGVMMHGMPVGEALNKYCLLTIGDGLLSQIPALFNAVAAGMIVTRVVRGEGTPLSRELLSQLTQLKRVQVILACIALAVAVLPGMPYVPSLCFAALLALMAMMPAKAQHQEEDLDEQAFSPKAPAVLRVELNRELGGAMYALGNLGERFDKARERIYEETGLILARPDFGVITDGDVQIRIMMRGVLACETTQRFDGETGFEWVASQLDALVCMRKPEFVDDLLTRRALDILDVEAPELVSNVVPGVVSVTQLSEILRDLVAEGVSIRNFDLILQSVAEKAPKVSTPRVLLEEVRIALRRVVTSLYVDSDGKIKGITVDPILDLSLVGTEREAKPLDPELLEQLMVGIQGFMAGKDSESMPAKCVLLVSRAARRLLWDLLRTRRLDVPVLAFEEIADDIDFEMVGHVEANGVESVVEQLAA